MAADPLTRELEPSRKLAALLHAIDARALAIDRELHALASLVSEAREFSPLIVGEVPRGACPDLVIDAEAHIVTVRGGELPLTRLLFRLLEHFYTNPGIVLTPAQIDDAIRGFDQPGTSVEVKSLVCRLRKRLEPYGIDGLIETVRGVGYRYRLVPRGPQ